MAMTDKSLPNNPQDNNEPAKEGKTYATNDKSFEAVKWRFSVGMANRKAAAAAAAAAQTNMFETNRQ
jgi:hypothetical protein